MKVKLTGKQYKDFLNDEEYWCHGELWYEDALLTLNGQEEDDIDSAWIKNTDIITIEDGFLNSENVHHPKYGKSFVSFIKAWLKKQSCETILVEVPNEKKQEFLKWLETHKCKIVN